MTTTNPPAPPAPAAVWTGRVLSVLIAGMFLMSATMKLIGSPEVAAGMTHLGLPSDILTPLGIVELGCVLLYLVPQTAVLGAILLSAYLGGAVATHVRIGEGFALPVALGVVAWFALWLREPRLHRLAPLRRL